MANVADVSPEGQHEEQTAEQVFPLGDPGHGFRPQRMNGEHGRHKGARPKIAGHLPQNQQQQNRHRGVQRHIGRVVPRRVLRAVELAIGRMREPRQRMPIAATEGGERPGHRLPAHAMHYVGIVVDVGVVVEVDEIVSNTPPEDDGHRQRQQAADGQDGSEARF